MHVAFKALLISHKHANVAQREAAALDLAAVRHMLAGMKDLLGASEVIIISTCNRTEFYYVSETDLSSGIVSLLRLQNGIVAADLQPAHFHHLTTSSQSVAQLFRVALGLESLVPGDLQIINQVKQAYQASVDEGMAGPFLHRLLHTIFFANKRVVQETQFRTGAASVAYVAQELAEDLLTNGFDSRIVVLGVGEIGRNLCANLVSAGYKNVVILNRTVTKAQELADGYDLSFGGLDALPSHIAGADLIISCLAAREPIILPVTLAGLPASKRLLIFDLSMPRSVSPEVEVNPSVFLYNLDSLQMKATEALTTRMAEVPKVEAILEESLVEFGDWSREMIVSPAIQRFKDTLEKLRQEELSRALKQLTPEQMEVVERITGSLVQKIVKLPVLELKAACRRGDAENLSESLLSLFNLEQPVR